MAWRIAIRWFFALAVLLVAIILLARSIGPRVGTRPVSGVAPRDTASLDAGRRLFHRECWFCHGTGGRGDGPVARFLPVPPRDFTLAQYKIRSTPHDALPTAQDLFLTISRGLPGTHMPGWHTLTELERWQLVAFLQSFSDRFAAPGAAPEVTASDAPSGTAATVERGKQRVEQAKCWLCHDREGRGNGPITAALVSQWGLPYRARNLQDGESFHGGSTVEDIFRTLTTGLDGTPMGSQATILSAQERWQVACYVAGLAGRNLPRNQPLETGVSWQRGRWVFFGRGRCLACHKVEGKGEATRGPDLSRIGRIGATRRPGQSASQYIFESITDPAVFQAPDYPPAMPLINQEAIFLEADEIRSLVVYLSSQGSGEKLDRQQLAALPNPPPPDRVASRAEMPPSDRAHGWEVFRSEQALCSKCHCVHGQGGAIGPVLTNLSTMQSPRQVRESLLEPNKVVSHSFQQVTVALASGRLAQGVVVRQDAREIHLADSQGQIQVVPREQIEELVARQGSLMPSDVAAKLPAKDQRDLLAFLWDQQPALESSLAQRRPSPLVNPWTRAKHGPPLANVVHKAGRSWLADWLKDPQRHDPQAFMPNLQLSREEIAAVLACLSAQAGPRTPRHAWDVDWAAPFAELNDDQLKVIDRRREAGQRLWSESRCTICHRVGERGGVAVHAPALTRAAMKLRPDWVLSWLQDPHREHPTTHMPQYRFTAEQGENLVTYLLRGEDFGGFDVQVLPDSEPEPASPTELVRRGREVITRSRCIICHDIPGIDEVLPRIAPWPEPRNEYEKLVRDRRCLSCHRMALGAASSPSALAPVPAASSAPGAWHSARDGGAFAPDLTTVGSRLRRGWLERFLVAPDVVRPLLNQMPKLRLTPGEAGTVADYAKRNLTDPGVAPEFLADYQPTAEDLVRGRQIYDAKGCRACHQIGTSGGAIGPALTTVADRLEPGYIYEYLKSPQRFMPDAVEPNYGLSNREALELTKFLLSLRAGEGMPK